MEASAVWVADALFFLFGLSTVGGTGLFISPCGNDAITEVVADQETVFTCTAKGRVQWRLQISGRDRSVLLATCEQTCQTVNNYSGLLIASIKEARQSSFMTIGSQNLSDKETIKNASLLCVLVDENSKYLSEAGCGLNYVYPPEDVSCTATNASWSVSVSCAIRRVYSSRRIYTCQLHREKLTSTSEALQLVNIVTSPTSKKISENEVKMSGSCQFHTALPALEGRYNFYVSVSPGGRTYTVNYTADDEWITVERPIPPGVSCGPQPFVLENTNITCTCDTASMGQPAGFLRWITGSPTNYEEPVREEQLTLTSHGLRYTQSLTLSDHANTWFRCDVIWGNETIPGGEYTAKVGYVRKPQRFSFNGHEGTLTVREGDHVHAMCEADGRPTPNVSIYNNDNNTLIWKESSITNFTFITRCEDTATYTCSAWNEFSSQSDVKTSHNISLVVMCKPRQPSSTHLPKFTSQHQVARWDFDIIAFPGPHNYRLWENNTDGSYNETEVSNINFTCKPDAARRYFSRCTLTVFNTFTQSKTGIYLLQVSNAVGDENFTVQIPYDAAVEVHRNAPADLSVVVVGTVVGVVILAVLVLVAVIGKIKKVRDRKQGLDEPEVVLLTSPPESCQAPLDVVVDKTEKKTNSRAAHALTTEEEMHREQTEGAIGTAPGCSQEPEVVYAVVDKARVTSPQKHRKAYRIEKRRSSVPDQRWCLDQPEVIFDTSQPESCQVPLYAAVDKTKKKKNSRPAHTVTTGEEIHRAPPEAATGQWNEVYLTEDESFYMNCDGTAIYQNDVQLAGRPLSQNEATDEKGRLPARPPPCCPPDDGRWANQDGLTYTLPIFDVSDDVGHRAELRGDKTDYCALRVIGKEIPYLDKR